LGNGVKIAFQVGVDDPRVSLFEQVIHASQGILASPEDFHLSDQMRFQAHERRMKNPTWTFSFDG
jgi:hypothetical protein